ncbi:MAG: acyltransferase family protein [Candidatus Bathyarchaeia archaeon]
MYKRRLLFVDLMRVFGAGLVVMNHAWKPEIDWLYHWTFNFFGLREVNYGSLGVTLFLVASGFSLAYNYSGFASWAEVKEFYKERLLRIYPAYWLFGVGFTLILFPSLWSCFSEFTTGDFIRLVTGFQSWGATSATQFHGKINGTLWFVQLIVCLYIAYPLSIYCFKKRPKLSLASTFAISALSTYYFAYHTNYYISTDWIPTNRLFEFAIGVFMAVTGKYPQATSNFLARYLGNLTFYVFLTNSSLLIFFKMNYLPFLLTLIVVSTAMCVLDKVLIKGLKLLYQEWRVDPWFMD